MTQEREDDIQKLCKAVLDMFPRDTGDSGSGACCPFCHKDCNWNANDLLKIDHELYCPVLIAKDLTVNL